MRMGRFLRAGRFLSERPAGNAVSRTTQGATANENRAGASKASTRKPREKIKEKERRTAGPSANFRPADFTSGGLERSEAAIPVSRAEV